MARVRSVPFTLVLVTLTWRGPFFWFAGNEERLSRLKRRVNGFEATYVRE